MSDRTRDSTSGHRRHHNEADTHMSYNEIKDRAKSEQTSRSHRRSHHDSDRRHDSRDRHRDREDNHHYKDQKRDRSDVRGERQSDRGGDEYGVPKQKDKSDGKVVEKQKPNFETTGKLAEDTNTFNGVVIKYSEPLEAHKPKRRWRLYPFKGEQSLNFIPIHRQSAYLLSRDRKVADIPIDHPSCSKQHSVIQFRLVEYEREDTTTGKRIRPYIIDLESSNGTFVNNQRIEAKRYYELFEKDVIKFGFSTREYVLLHELSQDEEEDDDFVVAEEGDEEEKLKVKDEPKE